MEQERFAAEHGRKRPAYTPKNISCPHCGAGLTLKDERSELVVCEYCGSHLNVSRDQREVLGKGAARKWKFPLRIGQSFRHKRIRYEILARLVFIEDGDESDPSREYLLYNPYHGTLWLNEYAGHYSISRDTHVMPTDDPFRKRRGDRLRTHDNREWILEGTGTYELAYVDGALPWIATIGDRSDYAEFLNAKNPKLQYEAQRTAGEVEYGRGESLSLEQVRRALGKSDFGTSRSPKSRAGRNVVKTARGFKIAFVLLILMLAVNLLLYLYASSRGDLVLEQRFSADQLTAETYSEPFRIDHSGDIVKIAVNADVDNAWMAMDVGIVMNEETLVHVDAADVSYYHGYEGGESWKEGSRNEALYVKIPWEGVYRLLVHAVSASGNAETAEQAQHSATVRVYAGALLPYFAMGMSIVTLLAAVAVFMAHHHWKNEED